MNERIRELAEQAGAIEAKTITNIPRALSLNGEEIEKFAKLLVHECMELTHWKDFDMSVEQRIRLSVYQDIKKHFEVEE